MFELVCTSEVGSGGHVQMSSSSWGVAKSPGLRSLRSVLVCATAGVPRMADDPVVAERGVVTAADEAWDLAVRRAGVIGPLAEQPRVGLEAADAPAARVGVSRRAGEGPEW